MLASMPCGVNRRGCCHPGHELHAWLRVGECGGEVGRALRCVTPNKVFFGVQTHHCDALENYLIPFYVHVDFGAFLSIRLFFLRISSPASMKANPTSTPAPQAKKVHPKPFTPETIAHHFCPERI